MTHVRAEGSGMNSNVAPCTVRLDMLQALAPKLLPVLDHQPVAVWQDDRPFCYLVGAEWLHARMHVAPGAVLADALPAGVVGVGTVGTQAVVPAPVPTVRVVANILLEMEAERVQRGAFSPASLQIIRNRLDLHILPELGALPVQQVQEEQLRALVQRLVKQGSSPTTLSQYLVIVRKMLRIALGKKWIREMPTIPQIQIHNKPRTSFTAAQYLQLLRTTKRLMRSDCEAPRIKLGDGARDRFWVTMKYRTLPPDMYWLIIFMVNSFVRPSDIKVLQHRHVEVVRAQHAYLRLTMPETKKHDKPIVTLQPAVRVYEHLLAHAQTQEAASPDDYLFLPQEKNREHALAILNFWLKWVLREAGIPLTDSHGQPRTLYCLRHTAITFRLLYGQGIDMLTLARNARTSVDMIENFYASTLTGEMNVAMLQSRRSQKKTPGREPWG